MLRHGVGKATAKPQAAIDKLHDDYAGIRMDAQQPESEPLIDDYQEPASIFIDWHAFIERDSTVNRWLVEDFWPWGRAMALWAGAKEGKSELALWCACKLALGEHPWLNGRAIEPIKVAYFDYEMNEDDLEERLDNFDIDPTRLAGWLHYAQFPPILPLDSRQGGADFEKLVLAIGAQAVVIDTFGRSVDGDENEADTVRAFYRHTGMALKRHLIGYLRTDHSGKDPGKGQRGSSAKRDDVDVIWNQRRVGADVLLDCSGSSRLSWVGPTLKLDRVVTATPEGNLIAYSRPIQMMGWTLPAMTKAAELDALGLPLDVSKRDAIAALKNSRQDPQGKANILLDALRYRRDKPASKGQTNQAEPPPGPRSHPRTTKRKGTSENQEIAPDLLFSAGRTTKGTTKNHLCARWFPRTS